MIQLKKRNNYLLVKKNDLFSLKKGGIIDRMGLYISKMLMLIGISLIVLNAAGLLGSSNSKGGDDFAALGMFLIGVIISIVSIPYLYFSSFEKYNSNDDFWSQEFFWILPLFFFGAFFQYMSGKYYLVNVLFVSIVLIFLVHMRMLFHSARESRKERSLAKGREYWKSMQYLTIYYLVFLLMFFVFDPLGKLAVFIR